MAREVAVPVGAAFDKRLAELVWEGCSQLARETISGKLALSVDFNANDIIPLILNTLSAIVVEKLKPQVLNKLEEDFSVEALTRKLASDATVTSALRDLESDLSERVDSIIESIIASRVQDQVALIIDHNVASSDFTSMVQNLALKAVESHVERRLGHGKPGVILNRAEEQIRQAGQ